MAHIKRRVEGCRKPDGDLAPRVSPATASNDLTHFRQSERFEIPMSDVIMFAVYSARRQDEITQ